MRSIELTLDDTTDAAVRVDWAALATAGVPSLASHKGATNRPHITVAAGPRLELGEGVAEAGRLLPFEVRFGGIILFPNGAVSGGSARWVLARQVVVSRQLLGFHEAVHEHVAGALEDSMPDGWTPHVTLARRLSFDLAGRALAVLGGLPPGQCVAARLWDGELRTVRELSA